MVPSRLHRLFQRIQHLKENSYNSGISTDQCLNSLLTEPFEHPERPEFTGEKSKPRSNCMNT